MPEFKTERADEGITRIFAFSTELMYLVEGTEQAVLIDTGSGICSLKACVDGLTDKKVITLLTHGHVDHAMGAGEFDPVYMSRKDEYIYLPHSGMEFRTMGMAMSPLKDEITASDLIPAPSPDVFLDLKDGDVFDLGGKTVEIYECPGHTMGSMVMLLPETRTLLLGDACNPFTFLFGDYSLSVEEYRQNLIDLKKKVDGRYDRVFFSHGDGEGKAGIIEEVIDVCDTILRGQADDIPFSFMGASEGLIAKAMNPMMGRVDGKVGNVVYNKERVFAARTKG